MNLAIVTNAAGVLAVVIASVAACGSTSSPPPAVAPVSLQTETASVHDALTRAIAGPARTPEERARDAHRHPVETLELFGLRPEMKVIELAPGGAWYTTILAPVVRDRGELAVTSSDPDGSTDDEATRDAKGLKARFGAAPETFGKVRTIIVRRGEPRVYGPEASADMVLTFRSVHNWVAAEKLGEVLLAIHRVLKPGGILGVEAHRASPGAPTDAKSVEKSGYLPEAYVIAAIEAAGFKLAARSEINANPRDTKDHPEGVWTLPPTFALKEVDRAKYAAIGETDRMTLKFVKQ